MKIIFGKEHYSYSDSIRLGSGKNYLPAVVFVDDTYDLGKNTQVGGPANIKDSPHAQLRNVISASGDYCNVSLKDAKVVDPERSAIRKALLDAVPDDKKRVLVVQKEFRGNDYEVYFAWLPLDKKLSELGNGADYKLVYYSSPYTCHPSTRDMIVCHNINTAVTHLLTIIPQVEAAIKIKAIRAEESRVSSVEGSALKKRYECSMAKKLEARNRAVR